MAPPFYIAREPVSVDKVASLNFIRPQQFGWGSSGGLWGQKSHAFNFTRNTKTGKRQAGYRAGLEGSRAGPATTGCASQMCCHVVRKLLADARRRKWVDVFQPRHNGCGPGEPSLPDLFVAKAAQYICPPDAQRQTETSRRSNRPHFPRGSQICSQAACLSGFGSLIRIP